MLYSASSDRWIFVVDQGIFRQNSFRDVVNGIYSIIKTHQVIEVAKQEVKFDDLVQELVEPRCQIKQDYLEEDLVHDDTFYFEMAAFKFQDTDFLVPTHQFVHKTDPDHFSAIFGPTFGTTETPDGFSGVTADDFRVLMKYLYPLDINHSDEPTMEDWIAILRLSTKWRMLTLREEAIQKLREKSNRLSAIMKVQLGKEFMIPEWVQSGYIALLEREEHFTEADVTAIGLDSVTKLCELREQEYAGEWDTYRNRLSLEAHGASDLIANKISRISAADYLDCDDDDFVTAILDAQSLGNRRLMLDAWESMARRLRSLTLNEVERLTLQSALVMWEVRLETRKAAWFLVQKCGAKGNFEALDASQRITSAFALELRNIAEQALNYTPTKFVLDNGKRPTVNLCGGHAEDKAEIPNSILIPPSSNARALLQQSLSLRTRIVDLEQTLKENTDVTLSRHIRRDLRVCRLSVQKWCALLAVASSPSPAPEPTLTLRTGIFFLYKTLPDVVSKLILKNGGKLSLEGSHLSPEDWILVKARILSFTASFAIDTRVLEDRRVIELILPISES